MMAGMAFDGSESDRVPDEGKTFILTTPISKLRLYNLQHVNGSSSVRGGKDDFGINADVFANVMPEFDDCIGAVDDGAIHVKELQVARRMSVKGSIL